MAEVFSNSPCMLGKRVLSPHSSRRDGLVGQLDFSSKKRRYGHGTDQGASECHEYESYAGTEPTNRSLSPVRAGKRARPLSTLQATHSGDVPFGFQQQQQYRHAENAALLREREAQELVALRREVGELRAQAIEKEGGLALAREDNARLRDGMSVYHKEVERLTNENRILKRAVGIQNTKGKEVESQLHSLQQAAGQAAEYMKRLEQTNYALSVRVQTMGNSGPSDFMGGQRPPDVY